MSDTNLVVLTGNVGSDPETRTFKNGGSVARFRMATNRHYTKDGERQKVTAWHSITVQQPKLVEIVERYVKKGSRITVIGRLQDRKYEKDGETRYAYDVEVSYDGQINLEPGGERSDNGGDWGGPPKMADNNIGPGEDDIPW